MKSVKFLQQARHFADYVVQTSLDVPASLPQPNPYSRSVSTGAQRKKWLEDSWDGQDRRSIEERRANDRRNEKQSAMLDTRMRSDRRRQTDESELRSFSCRV